MLAILREVVESGREHIITAHGKPVLRMVSIQQKATVE